LRRQTVIDRIEALVSDIGLKTMLSTALEHTWKQTGTEVQGKDDFRFWITCKRSSSSPVKASAGMVTVNFYLMPQPKPDTGTGAAKGWIHPDAVQEVSTGNAKMAQALRTVFKQTSEGRTAPGRRASITSMSAGTPRKTSCLMSLTRHAG
jgi:hypothetical protein